MSSLGDRATLLARMPRGVSAHARQRLEEHYGLTLVPAAWGLILLELRHGLALLVRVTGDDKGNIYAVRARYGTGDTAILVAYRENPGRITTVLPHDACRTILRQGIARKERTR